MGANKTYKVIQWATGNVGTRALRAIIEHPRYQLVGLYVTSPQKVGQDAGALCGLNRNVGVQATSCVDDIVAMDADCVVYLPAYTNWDHVCRLLASGKNIVTARGEFLHRATMQPENRARIEAACREGKSTIHTSGSSPGFITEGLTIPLIAQQRRLDCLTINEYADLSSRDSPDMIFNLMGYGQAPGKFNEQLLQHIKNDFAGSLVQIAEAINMPLDDITASGEFGLARQDTQIAAGTIKAGTVAALQITISGMHKGKALIKFRPTWYAAKALDKDWELPPAGWLVRVDGDTPLEVRISYPVAERDFAAFTPGLTAHPVVNAIPVVCQAEPGIRTTVELPQVIATF